MNEDERIEEVTKASNDIIDRLRDMDITLNGNDEGAVGVHTKEIGLVLISVLASLHSYKFIQLDSLFTDTHHVLGIVQGMDKQPSGEIH